MRSHQTPFWIALGIFVLAGLAPLWVMAGQIEDFIKKGNDYVAQKDYKKAAKEYENALKVDPDHAKANLLLGLTEANLGNMKRALECTQKAVKKEPSYAAYNNLGLIYADQADYKRAIESYEKAVSISPSAYRTWYQLGLVHSANLEFTKAVDAFNKVLSINPSFHDAYLGLGSAYYWTGDKVHALQQVESLKSAGKTAEADALAKWIEIKELKRSQSNEAPAPAPQA